MKLGALQLAMVLEADVLTARLVGGSGGYVQFCAVWLCCTRLATSTCTQYPYPAVTGSVSEPLANAVGNRLPLFSNVPLGLPRCWLYIASCQMARSAPPSELTAHEQLAVAVEAG